MYPFLVMFFCLLASARATPFNQTPHLPPAVVPDGHCETAGSWQAYAFLVEDCYAAIQQMYIQDVMRHPDEMYEFTGRGIRPKTIYTRIETPATYTVSECSF